MKIRPTRFQGNRVIEVAPASYEQIRELREIGLINIIQNSRNRFFLSETEETARETLEKVLKAYPPLYLLKEAEEAVCEQNTPVLTGDRQGVKLPEWLVEPPIEEVERIKAKEFIS